MYYNMYYQKSNYVTVIPSSAHVGHAQHTPPRVEEVKVSVGAVGLEQVGLAHETLAV